MRRGGYVSSSIIAPISSISSSAHVHSVFNPSTTLTSLVFPPAAALDTSARHNDHGDQPNATNVDTSTSNTNKATEPSVQSDSSRNSNRNVVSSNCTSAPAINDNVEEKKDGDDNGKSEHDQHEAKNETKSTEKASVAASPYKRVLCPWKGKMEPDIDVEFDLDSDIEMVSDVKKSKKRKKSKTKDSGKKTKTPKKKSTATKIKKKAAATKSKKKSLKSKREKMEKDESDESDQEQTTALSKQDTETEYFRYGDMYAAKPSYVRGGIKSDVSPKKQLAKAKHVDLRRSARLKKKPKVSFAQKSVKQLTTHAADKIVPDGSGGRRPRLKRDIVACREIQRYQNSTDLLLRRSVFNRLVREIAGEYKTELRFQKDAIELLQEATEAFIVKLLQDTQLCADHAKSSKIRPYDMRLAKRLRRNQKLPAYVNSDPMKKSY